MSTSFLTWRDNVPEVRPLTTVDELLAWAPSPPQARFCAATRPLAGPSRLRAARPRLLCCHDLRGNYLEDALCQGGGDASAYNFRHWDRIDAFVYFSHSLVTIPPPGWTDAAHRHGVPVLGTLITEWDAGAAACTALLASDATAEHAAHQLAKMAAFLGFDGWIANIENEVPVALIPRLQHFLRCLTQATRAAVPAAGTVIWYDAVTTEGRLQWQNALTPLNSPFLDACDGIWINYTWKEETPAAVRAAIDAIDTDRRYDVYLGVDAFGRGTLGGGGLACNVALSAAQQEGLSAALFACGWPYEKHAEMEAEDAAAAVDGMASGPVRSLHRHHHGALPGLAAWHARDDEFWKLIGKAWGGRHPAIAALPAFSDFCSGLGTGLAVAGVPVHPAAWYNLRLQSLQPALAFVGGRPRGLHATVTTAAAFSGGAAVALTGSLAAPAQLRLFNAAASVPPAGLRARLTAAVGSAVALSLCLRLRAPGGKELVLDLAPVGAPLSPKRSSIVKTSSQTTAVPFAWLDDGRRPAGLSGVAPATLPREWTTWQFAVGPGDVSGWPLGDSEIVSVEVLAAPKTSGAAVPCFCFVGAVGLWGMEDEGQPPLVAVEKLTVADVAIQRVPRAGGGAAAVLAAVLIWRTPPPRIERCHVWVRIGTEGDIIQGTQESPEVSPVKGMLGSVVWGPPQWVGVSCGAGFALSNLVLSEGAVAVRVYVATSAWAAVQPLRSAAALTIPLPHGVTSPRHLHTH